MEKPAGTRSEEGAEPDARFTFANERTLLAWVRTSLALIAGGVAVAQLRAGIGGAAVTVALALALIILGAALAYSAYRRWGRNQRALRLGQPLPPSAVPRVLVYGVVTLSAAAIALALLQAASR